MLHKKDIIRLLQNAPLDVNEYWIASGAALVIYGIKGETRDIDLGCTSKMADKLEQNGYSVNILCDGERKIALTEQIELFENWIEDRIIIFEGLPLVSLDGILKMKKKLGRKKDFEDIALINEYREKVSDKNQKTRL